jgi:membrane protease YdiL (CAAX protease family)
MHHSYLDGVRQGKNSWWRYVLGTFIIQFCFQVVGVVVLFVLIYGLSAVLPLTNLEKIPQPIAAYVVVHFPFLFFILGTALVMAWLHRRSVLSLVSADHSIHLRRFLSGFLAWFAMLTVSQMVFYGLAPDTYQFSFEPLQWFMFLPFALLLTPIQTTAEELFFRGYLLQGLGLISRHPLFLIGVTSFLFLLPHLGNPEVHRGFVWVGLGYWVWGVFFAAITLKDDRLELAMGSHAANNLFAALFINSTDSVLPSPAVWTVEPGDPRVSLVYQLLISAAFYYLFFGRQRKSVPPTPQSNEA